jgi:beta-galactosidase
MKKHVLGITCGMLALFTAQSFADRMVQNFNGDWRFAKGEQTEAAKQLDFDDSGWEAISLPHDWAIAGPFNPEEHGYAGKLPWKGVGWYRKIFTLDKADAGKQVYLDFDGVMAFPKVYVNGQLAGEWDYGYMSFRVDATPYVKFGEKNVVAVVADTRNHGTRWYPGAGIYRKVTMTICNPAHVGHWSTYITTPLVDDKTATVQIRSTIENHCNTESKVNVSITLLDPKGKVAAAINADNLTIPAGNTSSLDQLAVIKNPQRWDITSPNLYTAKIVVTRDGKVVDTDIATFGIRTFEFTADDGFHLNGRRVQLQGVCLHHDQGPLGAAFYPRAMQRQLEIMRDMGCNAIRTSHNPPAPELLELCDKMGFVVWDECFDKWDDKADRVKGQPPLEEYGEKQIHNFVMRDRNHPCIVVWSIANEIGAKSDRNKEGLTPERVKFMREFVLKYDATRPVGLALCVPEIGNSDIPESLDLTGWNYMRRYNLMKEHYPDKPIIYSESASALSTRGFYELPLPSKKTEYSKQMQVNSYDHNAADWSDIPDREFDLMRKDTFVAGEFVWTGFDYIGEPTPFDKEARSSYFGIVDLCGIPKDRYYLYRSYWRPEVTTIHILPHWNWPDRIGKNVPVYVYSNGDTVELFLNGKSLGRKTKIQSAETPENIALGKPVKASSEETDKGNLAAMAVDGNGDTRWCAANGDADQWWQVDLGKVQPVHYITLDFEKEVQNYTYQIQVSEDESNWKTVAEKKEGKFRGNLVEYPVDIQARYVRIQFNTLTEGTWASICEVGIYSKAMESPYYASMNNYRFRWMNVVYQPGELKAVAYKNGKKIGEEIKRTAGAPAAIRLTPDRTKLSATGQDLSYVLVEAVDAKGNLCPLADTMIHFDVQGLAKIAGIDNGNPMSFESFQSDHYKLFYGKAMLVIRTEGKNGDIHITAKADSLKDGSADLHCGDNLLESIFGIFGIK